MNGKAGVVAARVKPDRNFSGFFWGSGLGRSSGGWAGQVAVRAIRWFRRFWWRVTSGGALAEAGSFLKFLDFYCAVSR
jgi:hypothetical protein